MATSLALNSLKCFSRTNRPVCAQFVRFRWKPPEKDEEILPTYEERLSAWKAVQEKKASDGVNIGMPFTSTTNGHTKLERLRKWAKERSSLEKLARHGQLQIDLEEVQNEWSVESGPAHISRIAKHYGIFDDMYDGAHFDPIIPLRVAFDYDEEFVTPVFHGNLVPANEAAVQPYVAYQPDQEDGTLWTLVMSSPDGNLESNDKELIHWMVCNIPDANLDQGQTICNYMQPFPVWGAGYLRYVFVLYKQAHWIDLSEEKRQPNCLSLRDRNFSTLTFYSRHQDCLTPAGLAFFQSTWDKSVRSFLHNTLDMPEPVFEFMHPPAYIPPQVRFPHNEPFNLYLDQYRDRKDIQEEVLKHKLKAVDPFSPIPARLKYPNAERIPIGTPSWLKHKIYDMRLGHNQWKDLYDDDRN